MSIQNHFTPTQACTLIAHEAVSMLDTVQTELPQCVTELRTALEALCTLHQLGHEGEILRTWLDTEIANAERFIADGTNLPNLIDLCRMNTVPDAVAQMDLVWLLFDTAAMEGCAPEQRQALLGAARSVTEMCGLDDLLLATVRSNADALATGLNAELADVLASLQAAQAMPAQQESAPAEQEQDGEPVPPDEPVQ